MADGGLHTKPQPQNKKNPTKFYSHFIFKATIITLFLVILPLFPSSEPHDVTTPSIFSRWWELLHLILVGIAVSYGLFSRKNDELVGENHTQNSKFDSAQSYMSKLLQVPSVFDDDLDDKSNDSNNNVNKIQTWSSQYHRNQPVLVVAKDGSFVDNNGNSKDCEKEKPLLLPVRSLKSRVSDENDGELVNKVNSRVYSRSNSNHNPREVSSESRKISRNEGNLGDGEENVSRVSKGYTRSNSSVSRSNSFKSKSLVNDKEFGFGSGNGEGSRSLSKSSSSSISRVSSSVSRKPSSGNHGGLDDEEVREGEEKNEESVVLPSPIPWRSRSGKMEVNRESIDSSLHSLPPSLEESGAAQLLRSQSSLSSRSSSSSSSPKELSPSPSLSLSSPKRVSPTHTPSLSSESLAKSVEDFGRRKLVYAHPPPPPPPPPPPAVRLRSTQSQSSKEKELKRNVWSEPSSIRIHSQGRNGIDSSSMGKSVRTIRASDTMSSRKTREIEDENESSEDFDSDVFKNTERSGYNPITKQSFSEFPKETRDFIEHVFVESDDESGSEDETCTERANVENAKPEEVHTDSVDEGPDVDKKADEFIAKFREQIRLQRIESIKRSAGQLKRRSVR